MGLCPRARALRCAHVWVRCIHVHVHKYVCGHGGVHVCTRHPVLACVYHACVCRYWGPRVSICQRVQVRVYTCVCLCYFLLKVGGTSSSFSHVCSLSMTCSRPCCFLLFAASNPSPSKDSGSSGASALTFQPIPALKSQTFPGTQQECNLGWMPLPLSSSHL